jgi:MoaA/NifB/PqqE/SkfB family radical SAM enzyme
VNQAKLLVFPGSLEYRFAAPGQHAESPTPLERLLAQLRETDERCQRLVISGGSPLQHPHFVEIARASRARGFPHMTLETDAASLARHGVLTVLERLGFTELVIVMGGLRTSVHDAMFQAPGTLPAAIEGLTRAIAHAGAGGMPVYLVAPMLTTNIEDLDALLDWATGLPGSLKGFLLSLPEIARVPPESRSLLLRYSTQAQIAARLFRKCQGRGVEYGFATKRGILRVARPVGARHRHHLL